MNILDKTRKGDENGIKFSAAFYLGGAKPSSYACLETVKISLGLVGRNQKYFKWLSHIK